jgi:hypothetical protein
VSPEESPELRFEIRRALARREFAIDLLEDEGEEPPPFSIEASPSDDRDELGAEIRRHLGIDMERQATWRQAYDSFNGWRALIEAAGALVLQMTDVEMAEARGFSISEFPLPTVVREVAKAAGVRLEISYSYRTYEKQVEKYEIYKNGGNRAADPGTSNHGWGTALDLSIPTYPEANTDPQFRWLKTIALRFGFHNNDSPSEPWHWDYEGGHPIEEDRMTPEEKAEFDAMKKTVADHEKLIAALREGLGTKKDPRDIPVGRQACGAFGSEDGRVKKKDRMKGRRNLTYRARRR